MPDTSPSRPARGLAGHLSRLIGNTASPTSCFTATPAPSTPAPVEIARAAGLTIHVFEEGYLRPHWVTYERGGSNGHSRLMQLTVADMQKALVQRPTWTCPMPPPAGATCASTCSMARFITGSC
jgi:capsular polysaccharide export protein